jgi:hypothetical protein
VPLRARIRKAFSEPRYEFYESVDRLNVASVNIGGSWAAPSGGGGGGGAAIKPEGLLYDGYHAGLLSLTSLLTSLDAIHVRTQGPPQEVPTGPAPAPAAAVPRGPSASPRPAPASGTGGKTSRDRDLYDTTKRRESTRDRSRSRDRARRRSPSPRRARNSSPRRREAARAEALAALAEINGSGGREQERRRAGDLADAERRAREREAQGSGRRDRSRSPGRREEQRRRSRSRSRSRPRSLVGGGVVIPGQRMSKADEERQRALAWERGAEQMRARPEPPPMAARPAFIKGDKPVGEPPALLNSAELRWDEAAAAAAGAAGTAKPEETQQFVLWHRGRKQVREYGWKALLQHMLGRLVSRVVGYEPMVCPFGEPRRALRVWVPRRDWQAVDDASRACLLGPFRCTSEVRTRRPKPFYLSRTMSFSMCLCHIAA